MKRFAFAVPYPWCLPASFRRVAKPLLVACGLAALCGLAAGLPALRTARPEAPRKFEVFRLAGGEWQPYRRDIRASEHILILTHGVMENISSAFPPATAARIEQLGKYDDVLGVTYDWSEPPDRIAPLYAALLRSLPHAAIDMEAHSYGAVQTLAAIDRSGIYPRNLILLGAPLNGTPFAEETPLTQLALRLPPAFWNGNVASFRHMRVDGAEHDLAPRSPELQKLARSLAARSNSNPVHIILIAGSDRWGPQPLANFYFRVFHIAAANSDERNDGVIPVGSALGIGNPAFGGAAIVRAVFPLRHDRLRDDVHVMTFIAHHLKR